MSWQSKVGRLIVACTWGCCLLLLGCASQQAQNVSGMRDEKTLRSSSSGKSDLVTINSLFVSQLESLPGLEIDRVDRELLYNQLVDSFSAESGIDIVRDSQKPDLIDTPPREISDAIRAARTAGASAVLRTLISKFSRREGAGLGVKKAATLAVRFSIVRVADNREVWQSNYLSAEQASSYNLLEVTRRLERDKGINLPSIETLIREAGKRAALDFAKRRTEQFTHSDVR